MLLTDNFPVFTKYDKSFLLNLMYDVDISIYTGLNEKTLCVLDKEKLYDFIYSKSLHFSIDSLVYSRLMRILCEIEESNY